MTHPKPERDTSPSAESESASTAEANDTASLAESPADSYGVAVRQFNERAHALGLGDLSRYFWYHTVELPNGLLTPGQYDFRSTIDAFGFPEDLRGLQVLDVGTATGFFAFELERRGAQVTAVDLPSLEDLDRFPGQDTKLMLSKIEAMLDPSNAGGARRHTAAELTFFLLEGPFELCRQQLGSRVERCLATIYELPRALAGRSFDLVFVGDVLLHTLRPFDALAAVAQLCRGTLVVAQEIPGEPEDEPALLYVGGADPSQDDIKWWMPNQSCFVQLLAKLGFGEVEVIGDYYGTLRPSGYDFKRSILHAHRHSTSSA
ncbi:MAG: class I SAM-dependent methyltransferase [Acidobacteriota bacterium]